MYAIRLANGQVQPVTETTALTSEQVDGLLGGGAELVWVDPSGNATALAVLCVGAGRLDGEEGETNL